MSSSTRCGQRGRNAPTLPDESEHPTLDVDRVLETLARHNVEYLLIGGVAGRLYGAERATYDVDVLAHLRDAGGRRLGYEDLVGRARATRVGAVTVRLAGLADIIESKRAADREKDRAAVPELEALLDREEL